MLLFSCWEDLHLVSTEVQVGSGCPRLIRFFGVFAKRVFCPTELLFQVMWRLFSFVRMKREDPRFEFCQLIFVLEWLLLDGLSSI